MNEPYPLPAFGLGRRIVLASGSPRRRELLGWLGVEFDIVPADVDESPEPGELPGRVVARLAEAKARAVAAGQPVGTAVIGADTVVEIADEMLGKPVDAADAGRMLRLLSGRTHRVHTAVAVSTDGTVRSEQTVTDVTFVQLSAAAIDWYIGTGEPLDKAGGYGLQGVGGIFVSAVRGTVSGVLGLPLDVVVRLLEPRHQPGHRPAEPPGPRFPPK